MAGRLASVIGHRSDIRLHNTCRVSRRWLTLTLFFYSQGVERVAGYTLDLLT